MYLYLQSSTLKYFLLKTPEKGNDLDIYVTDELQRIVQHAAGEDIHKVKRITTSQGPAISSGHHIT
jgi:hypothetical protein